jgi:hypothetical protein
MIKRCFHLLILINFFSVALYSQNCTDTKIKIKMLKTRDGTTILGDFVKRTDSTVTIDTKSLGILNIPLDQVASDNDIMCSRVKNGEYWYENSGSNFYLITPSAFSPGKGNFYYKNSFLVFNLFGYGITDNISISAGFDFISMFQKRSQYYYDRRHPAFLIIPKVDFQVSNNLRMGASFIFIKDDGNYLDKSIGVPVINCAYGNEDRNISVNFGYNLVKIKYYPTRFYYVFAGTYRVLNRIALVMEYDHLNEKEKNLIDYGLKFIARKMSVDFGFINNSLIYKQIIIGVPYLSLTLKI